MCSFFARNCRTVGKLYWTLDRTNRGKGSANDRATMFALGSVFSQDETNSRPGTSIASEIDASPS